MVFTVVIFKIKGTVSGLCARASVICFCSKKRQQNCHLDVQYCNIKITVGNYVTLIIICHEHQNKLKYILIKKLEEFINSLIKPFIDK